MAFNIFATPTMSTPGGNLQESLPGYKDYFNTTVTPLVGTGSEAYLPIPETPEEAEEAAEEVKASQNGHDYTGPMALTISGATPEHSAALSFHANRTGRGSDSWSGAQEMLFRAGKINAAGFPITDAGQVKRASSWGEVAEDISAAWDVIGGIIKDGFGPQMFKNIPGFEENFEKFITGAPAAIKEALNINNIFNKPEGESWLEFITKERNLPSHKGEDPNYVTDWFGHTNRKGYGPQGQLTKNENAALMNNPNLYNHFAAIAARRARLTAGGDGSWVDAQGRTHRTISTSGTPASEEAKAKAAAELAQDNRDDPNKNWKDEHNARHDAAVKAAAAKAVSEGKAPVGSKGGPSPHGNRGGLVDWNLGAEEMQYRNIGGLIGPTGGLGLGSGSFGGGGGSISSMANNAAQQLGNASSAIKQAQGALGGGSGRGSLVNLSPFKTYGGTLGGLTNSPQVLADGGLVYAQNGAEIAPGAPIAPPGALPPMGPEMATPEAAPAAPALPPAPPARPTFAERVMKAKEAIQGGTSSVPATPAVQAAVSNQALDGQGDGPVEMMPGSGQLMPTEVGPDQGVDTVDAMMPEGSFVMNPEASEMYGDEIRAMCKGGMV